MGWTRKATVAAALGAATVLGIAGPAFADDCINLSRPAGEEGEMKGRWVSVSIPGVADAWLFGSPDNFMNGQGDALLTNATCPTARLEGQSGGVPDPSNLNGIWSEECFDKAIAG